MLLVVHGLVKDKKQRWWRLLSMFHALFVVFVAGSCATLVIIQDYVQIVTSEVVIKSSHVVQESSDDANVLLHFLTKLYNL